MSKFFNFFKSLSNKFVFNLVSGLIVGLSVGVIVLAFNNPLGNPPIGTGAIIDVGSGAPASSLYINSSGNVGIGTAAPQAKLDIRTPSDIIQLLLADRTTDAGTKEAFIAVPSYLNAEEPVAVINARTESAANHIYIGGNDNTIGIENAATSIRFLTAAAVNTVDGIERMRIDSAGNVGIGTTTPSSVLHVKGTSTNTVRVESSSSEADIQYISTAGDWQSGVDGNGFYIYDTAYRFVVKPATGNVGIGTVAPQGLLQVDSATSNALKVRIHTESATTNNLAGLAFGVDTVNQYMKSSIAHQRKGSNGMGDLLFLVDSNNDAADVGIGDEKIRITSTGRVGIGTASPSSVLHVKGASSTVTIESSSSDNADIHYNTTAGNWQSGADSNGFFIYDTAYRFVVKPATGRVGIGTTAPAYQLQVATDSAAKPGTNTWTVSSDARIKTDTRPFTDGLNTILGINPVWYKYNGLGGFTVDGKDNIGVIAQDIQKVAPYTVSSYYDKLNLTDATTTELLNFNSGALTFTTINAIKELNNKIEALEAENEALKKRVEILETR